MYQSILVPIDGGPVSRKGLDLAIQTAKMSGGRLRLMHVIDETVFALTATSYSGGVGDILPLLREAGTQTLSDAKARVEAQGVHVDTVLRESMEGRVCDLVMDEAAAWPADLIVIGTHGRRGVRRALLGSDAEQILRLANVPVLLVRGDEPPSGQ